MKKSFSCDYFILFNFYLTWFLALGDKIQKLHRRVGINRSFLSFRSHKAQGQSVNLIWWVKIARNQVFKKHFCLNVFRPSDKCYEFNYKLSNGFNEEKEMIDRDAHLLSFWKLLLFTSEKPVMSCQLIHILELTHN